MSGEDAARRTNPTARRPWADNPTRPRYMEAMRESAGFTVVELMITLAVAAILITVAVPAFHQFMHNNRMTTQANELVSAITVARSEAIQRRQEVAVCRFHNSGKKCDSDEKWHDGWAMYASENADSYNEDDDDLLSVHRGFGGDNRTTGVATVIYEETGYLKDGDGSIFLCGGDLDLPGREIIVHRTGRVEVRRFPADEDDDENCETKFDG